MNIAEILFTRDWWHRCLNDPAKLAAWLQKLQRTELGGFWDHTNYMQNNEVPERQAKILRNIAQDEFRHSDFLIELLGERKIEVVKTDTDSTYWQEILSHVHDLNDYYATNYFGEALASERFEVILAIPETPSDIREFINKALPDEIFHREALMRLAGEDALSKFQGIHTRAFNRLTGR